MVQLQLEPVLSGIEQRITLHRQELESLHSQQDAIAARMREIEKQLAVWQEAWKLELPTDDERRQNDIPNHLHFDLRPSAEVDTPTRDGPPAKIYEGRHTRDSSDENL